jgi:hypothetical protein
VIGSIRRECLDHIVVFNERHLRRVRRTSTITTEPAHISRSIGIAPTPARFSIAASEESSPSQKSLACIIATNVWPPDSYPIPLTNRLRGGPYAVV